MKKYIAIIAFLGILFQTFSQVLVVAEYYAQKDYIAKNLCENRNKPQMHCDGKCCLKKKLAKEAKEQGGNTKNQRSEETTVLFLQHTTFKITTYPVIIIPARYFSYNELGTVSFHHSVFHPPTA